MFCLSTFPEESLKTKSLREKGSGIGAALHSEVIEPLRREGNVIGDVGTFVTLLGNIFQIVIVVKDIFSAIGTIRAKKILNRQGAKIAKGFFWNTIDAEHWIFSPVCEEGRLFIQVFCHFVEQAALPPG